MDVGLAEQVKKCRDCGRLLPFEEFYRYSAPPRGLRGDCKTCSNAKTSAYKRADPVRRKERDDRWRAANPEKVQQTWKRRVARDRESGLKVEKNRQWRLRHPDRAAAHYTVTRALRSGALVRPDSCEACAQIIFTEAHHDDYAKRLDVRWLCRKCHAKLGAH